MPRSITRISVRMMTECTHANGFTVACVIRDGVLRGTMAFPPDHEHDAHKLLLQLAALGAEQVEIIDDLAA